MFTTSRRVVFEPLAASVHFGWRWVACLLVTSHRVNHLCKRCKQRNNGNAGYHVLWHELWLDEKLNCPKQIFLYSPLLFLMCIGWTVRVAWKFYLVWQRFETLQPFLIKSPWVARVAWEFYLVRQRFETFQPFFKIYNWGAMVCFNRSSPNRLRGICLRNRIKERQTILFLNCF